MTRASKNAILGAAAKTLAWELFYAAGYCRVRAPVNVERFERELYSAVKRWRRTQENLNHERRKSNGKANV